MDWPMCTVNFFVIFELLVGACFFLLRFAFLRLNGLSRRWQIHCIIFDCSVSFMLSNITFLGAVAAAATRLLFANFSHNRRVVMLGSFFFRFFMTLVNKSCQIEPKIFLIRFESLVEIIADSIFNWSSIRFQPRRA